MELSLEWAEDRCCKLIGRFDSLAGGGGGGGGECIDKDRNGYDDCNQ